MLGLVCFAIYDKLKVTLITATTTWCVYNEQLPALDLHFSLLRAVHFKGNERQMQK
jgi:hypothetical protein